MVPPPVTESFFIELCCIAGGRVVWASTVMTSSHMLFYGCYGPDTTASTFTSRLAKHGASLQTHAPQPLQTPG